MATLIVVSDLAEPFSIGRGGLSAYVLQWVIGLERLGHDVYFFEFLKKDPGSERDSVCSYFKSTIESWWHPDRSSLVIGDTYEVLYGISSGSIASIAKKAKAVITIAAPYQRDCCSLISKVRPRIFIEQDPGYTHLWAEDGNPMDVFGSHDIYFTVGVNIGKEACHLPTLNINWKPIRNPVVIDLWTCGGEIKRPRFTTAADWRSYGYLEFEGKTLCPKAEEFRKFMNLPKLALAPMEIVLNIDPDDPDRNELLESGWLIENPNILATPDLYREYISRSMGEFSCVKGGYAGTNCGWFSDRSACYLAAGRPVVLQSTGFEDLLPTGAGLFAVSNVDEAVQAVTKIRENYAYHSSAAREIAIEYFDSNKILLEVLKEASINS